MAAPIERRAPSRDGEATMDNRTRTILCGVDGSDHSVRAATVFTVAIFISVLAFEDETLQTQAKLAILIASAVAAIIGLAVLYARHRFLSQAPSPAGR
jgi:hypothetical protein